jgi:predicted DNA-binding protein YlxM (UPF0122 family)
MNANCSFRRLTLIIAEIIETRVNDILEINRATIYHQININKDTFIVHQEVVHLYQHNKEKSEKIELLNNQKLKDKDSMISQLLKIKNKFS